MLQFKLPKKINAFDIFNVVFMILLSLIFIIPFIVILSTSFISEQESLRRAAYVLFPENIDFSAYNLLLNSGKIVWNAYQVTLFRVIMGTFLNLVFTTTLAYSLARKQLPGKNGIILFIFITMIFHGGLIPTVMVIDNLGLKNSLWVMIIPSLISAWNLFIMRNFFLGIPDEIEESATIDGASPLSTLIRIVLPISMPSIATIGLFYAVYHWNEWFSASIYINDYNKLPIQVIMRNILMSGLIQDEARESMDSMPPPSTLRSAIIIISTLPILFVYPFIQRYFVKGTLVGSIKG